MYKRILKLKYVHNLGKVIDILYLHLFQCIHEVYDRSFPHASYAIQHVPALPSTQNPNEWTHRRTSIA